MVRTLSQQLRPRKGITEYDLDTEYHFRCLLISLVLYFFLLGAWARDPSLDGPCAQYREDYPGWCDMYREMDLDLLHLFAGLALFIYLGESVVFAACCDCWCVSSTLRYLMHVRDSGGSQKFQESLQRARPDITMHVECYHYETRTRTYTDSKGRRRTRTERVKVVTYTGRRNKTFCSWADASGNLPTFETAAIRSVGASAKTRIMKIKNIKSYEPLDAATEAHFAREASAFKAANRHRDVHMSYSESFFIPGFVSKTLTIDGPTPCALGPGCYVLASLLGLTWPYRMWMECKSFRVEWSVKKVLSIGNIRQQLGAADPSAPVAQAWAPLVEDITYYSPYDDALPIAKAVESAPGMPTAPVVATGGRGAASGGYPSAPPKDA
jgi:hypothetical protein